MNNIAEEYFATLDPVVSAFAADVITQISKALQQHEKARKDLALKIPGILHSHSYRADNVTGCVYCTRAQIRESKIQIHGKQRPQQQ